MIKSNKKVVRIFGAGFTNKGAEAMLLTVARAIHEDLPAADIVARVKKEDLKQDFAQGLVRLETAPPKSKLKRLFADIISPKIRYENEAIIDVGGYQFGDPWGEKYTLRKAEWVEKWNREGRLVFFMPQAWGPFSSPVLSNLVRSIINASTLSFARDKTSLVEMRKLVGADNPKVRFAHDIAWNFDGDELSIGRQLLHDAGISQKNNALKVCITPNLHVYKRSKGQGPLNEYIKLLADIIEHLCCNHNAVVVLLGHQILKDNSKEDDDRILCNYVLSIIDRSLPVVYPDNVFSAAQLKSIIGNCDLLLSSRYHALIAALSQGIPSASFGWSHKYDELMADVGLNLNVLSSFKEKKEVLCDVDAIVGSMPQDREKLKSTVPIMKHSGQKAIDEVVSLIRQNFQIKNDNGSA